MPPKILFVEENCFDKEYKIKLPFAENVKVQKVVESSNNVPSLIHLINLENDWVMQFRKPQDQFSFKNLLRDVDFILTNGDTIRQTYLFLSCVKGINMNELKEDSSILIKIEDITCLENKFIYFPYGGTNNEILIYKKGKKENKETDYLFYSDWFSTIDKIEPLPRIDIAFFPKGEYKLVVKHKNEISFEKTIILL